MIKFKEKEIITKERKIISCQCDRCKVDYIDDFEIQEFHFIRFTGGYDSVFGDGDKVECDICQHCLKKIIEKYCRVNNE